MGIAMVMPLDFWSALLWHRLCTSNSQKLKRSSYPEDKTKQPAPPMSKEPESKVSEKKEECHSEDEPKKKAS